MSRTITPIQVKEWFRPENKNALPHTSGRDYTCGQKVTFEGEEFDSNVDQLLGYEFSAGLQFVGCKFNSGLVLKNIKIRGGLKFINCQTPILQQIRPGLHFQDFYIDSLEITDCTLKHGVFFERPSSPQAKNTLNTISVNKGSFSNGDLKIERTEIKSGFHFKGVKSCQNLVIIDCQIGKISDVDNFKTKQIDIRGKELVFKDDLNIWRVKGVNKLSITSGKFEGNVNITKPIISNKMDFQNLDISKS